MKIFFKYILTRKKNKNDMPMKLVSKPDLKYRKYSFNIFSIYSYS